MLVLTDAGKMKTAYTLLLNETYPSWGYMIRKGATTMWERWNGDTGNPAMNSFNHYAFGAVGQWLYRSLAGIRSNPATPGFKRIVIDPHPETRLAHVSAEYDSLYGPISSAWTLGADGKLTLNVTIPANTTATIHVPAARTSHVTASEGAIYSGINSSGRNYAVGAGSYSFSVQ